MRESAQKPAYIPAIDGLRAIAVVGVLIYHLNRSWLPGGFAGVDVFFVVSGYLITSILVRDCIAGEISLVRFYQRRIARLAPAMFVVTAVTAAAGWFVYFDQERVLMSRRLIGAALSASNFFLLRRDYFAGVTDVEPFLHYWSLGVEEQFYLVFPLFLIALGALSRRAQWAVYAGTLLSSLVFCVLLTHSNPGAAFYLPFTRAWELLAGGALAMGPRQLPLGIRRWLQPLGMLTILASFWLLRDGHHFPGYIVLMPVAGTTAMIATFDKQSAIIERVLSWNPIVALGKVSYSLYLCHWPVIALIADHFYQRSATWRSVLSLALALPASLICYHLVEKPGRTYFNRPENRRFTFQIATAVIIFLAVTGLTLSRIAAPEPLDRNVATGGLEFNSRATGGRIVIVGDSLGVMYTGVLRELATEFNLKLNILAISAGQALPYTAPPDPRLWRDSVSFIRRVQPDIVVMASAWSIRIPSDPERLRKGVDTLRPYCGRILVVTQQSVLPDAATRQAVRDGNTGPFKEDIAATRDRLPLNEVVSSLAGGNVRVVDPASIFVQSDGSIMREDPWGHQLFVDWGHLTPYGTSMVAPLFRTEIADYLRSRQLSSSPAQTPRIPTSGLAGTTPSSNH